MAFNAVCPRCGGQGTIEDLLSGSTAKIIVCPDCQGSGVYSFPVPKIFIRCPKCGNEIDLENDGFRDAILYPKLDINEKDGEAQLTPNI